MRPSSAAWAATAAVVLSLPAVAAAQPRARAATSVPPDKIMHVVFDVESAERTLRFEAWHGDDLRIGRATETLLRGSIESHRAPGDVQSEPGTLIVEESSDGRTCDTYDGDDTILRRRCGDGNVVMSLAGYERSARQQIEHPERFGDRQTVRRVRHNDIPAYEIISRYVRAGRVAFTTRTVVAQRDYALLTHSQRAPDGTRTAVLRIRERELLARTEENEKLLRMNHPDATVRRSD